MEHNNATPLVQLACCVRIHLCSAAQRGDLADWPLVLMLLVHSACAHSPGDISTTALHTPRAHCTPRTPLGLKPSPEQTEREAACHHDHPIVVTALQKVSSSGHHGPICPPPTTRIKPDDLLFFSCISSHHPNYLRLYHPSPFPLPIRFATPQPSEVSTPSNLLQSTLVSTFII